MADAIVLKRGGSPGSGVIHVWKEYNLNTSTKHVWDKWSLVTTVMYKWNKWSVDNIDVVKKYYGGDTNNTGTVPDTVNGYLNPMDNDRYYTTADYLSGPRIWKLSGPTSFGNYVYHVIYNSGGYEFRAYDNQDVEFPPTFTYITARYEAGVYGMKMYDNYQPSNHVSNSYYIETLPVGTNVSNYPTSGFMSDGYWYAKSTTAIKGSTSYGQVTSTSSSAYPSNGVSGSYWYESAGSDKSYSKGTTFYGEVESTSSTAYPNGGHSGGYWYENRQEVPVYSMGTFKQNVYSTNPNMYPQNGRLGDYWYVYDGTIS